MDNLITMAESVREASRKLALENSDKKNAALAAMADALIARKDYILEANARDIERGRSNGMSEALLDRLALSESRVNGMAEGVRQLIALPDPVGEVIESFERPNGLVIEKVRVPFGVIGIIYEARPNVTIDSASIALKTGNGILLRGSASAMESNLALTDVMRKAIGSVGIDENVVMLISDSDHETVGRMMKLNGYIDVIIPRGGASLIRRVVEESTVPVLETGVGNCHVYIDSSADFEMAQNIVINAKTQRPAVCNAIESLLVHKDWDEKNLICILLKLMENGVKLHVDDKILALMKDVEKADESLLVAASDSDWGTEYLSLDISVKVVEGVDEAIEHITKYGTKHTECIVTENEENACKFMMSVDAACVNHNASTRFTDGFEFGFGAEIGISTQKLHARGPLGLKEMTSYKYLVHGNGQVRK